LVRALRWAALVAILAIPVLAYLGRPLAYTCRGTVDACEPLIQSSPGWTRPAEFAALAIGILLLLLAAVAKPRLDEDV
jgi:hypothetical protein